MEDNTNFDILDYLNQTYMMKMAPELNIQQAGGHHNRFGDDEKDAKDEITENNKKRIHIPNAEIKHFSYQQQGDIEEYNEPSNESSGDESTGKDGKGYNEVSDETKQKGRIGGTLGEKTIKIGKTTIKSPIEDIII